MGKDAAPQALADDGGSVARETENVAEVAGSPVAAAGSGRYSLRRKALTALALLALYAAAIGGLLGRERQQMFGLVDELEQVHRQEELLGRVAAATSQALLQANETYVIGGREPDWRNVALGAEAVQAGLYGLSKHFEQCGVDASKIGALLPRILTQRDRDTLLELRRTLHEQVGKIDALSAEIRQRKRELQGKYRFGYDALSLTAAIAGGLGVVVFGSVVALFFTRVAWDVKRLQDRARQIVSGYRGPPLPVTRNDEIGSLIESVNHMQQELRSREAQLELEGEERLHKEKMAAVGSLAASIAHEINNPIAAITGVAEVITETSRDRQCPHHGAACRPDLILEHARRVATITRQIAIFSRPASPEIELLDLNALVESTCNFVRYDPRFRAIELRVELDRQLPAIEAVADHITQVLMNLLVNAADAIGEAQRDEGVVTVVTRQQDAQALLEVHDNGTGMEQEVLEHAFDEHFTTKSTGRGSGLGLALCRRLLQRMGGKIEVQTAPGAGTTMRVVMPLSQAEQPQIPEERADASVGH